MFYILSHLAAVYFLNFFVSLPHQFLEELGKHVVHSIGLYVLAEVELCFYEQDVLELVPRKEEGKRARDGGMEREMSHFLCQTLLFSTKPCYFRS